MDLGILKNMDYSVYSIKDRNEYVKKQLNKEITNKALLFFTNSGVEKQLEGLANYILFGKDPSTDKNAVQDKDISIDVKNASFKRKTPESIEQLLEIPGYQENNFIELGKNIYTNPKPKIYRHKDCGFTSTENCKKCPHYRECDGWIPGMQTLWKTIDQLAEKLEGLKKEGTSFYKTNHLLIQLRQQQYILKESYKPTFRAVNRKGEIYLHANLTSDAGYIIEKEDGDWEWHEVSQNAVDLKDPKHMYAMICYYGDLKKGCWEDLECDARFLIYEFEDIVDHCALADWKKDILLLKIEKKTNSQIADFLYNNYGFSYGDNYISTILTKNICNELCDSAKLREDEIRFKDFPEKWKVCPICGKKKLNDKRNFTVNSAKKDGLSTKCKECTKKERQKARGNN